MRGFLFANSISDIKNNSNINNLKYFFGKVFGELNYLKWSLNKSEKAYMIIEGEKFAFVEPKNEASVLALQAGIIF